jgi:aspartyl/asparaginyl beta-hydroxylase (cupin superfamily)
LGWVDGRGKEKHISQMVRKALGIHKPTAIRDGFSRSQTQGEEHMTEYTYKTYGMARFHVPEGMYSIEEIEEMLANIKKAKRHQDEQLKAAMRPAKEKNT